MSASRPSPSPRRRRSRPSAQLSPAARGSGRGGYRAGAGRKPKEAHERRGHGPRPTLAARFPVHVTLRLVDDVPSLRRGRTVRALRRCLAAGKERPGFRLAHFSIQPNHLHLIVEADDARALSRGMQGLAVRLARGLNRTLDRGGRAFAERYHEHILRTPTEVRRALAYVLGNSRKHRRGHDADWVDDATSALWFTGWRVPVRDLRRATEKPPVAPPGTWLLREGWRRAGGPLDPDAAPA